MNFTNFNILQIFDMFFFIKLKTIENEFSFRPWIEEKIKLQKKMFDGAEPTESAQCCIINIGFRLLSYLHTTIALTHVSRAEKLPKKSGVL